MSRPLPLPAVPVLAWLVALLPGSSAAGAAPRQDGAFEAGLEEVEEHLRDQDWEDAHGRLVELVQGADGDEVLLHWAQISEGLQRSEFWQDYEPPEPRDVVSGRLLSWRERSGKIEIVYEIGQEERRLARPVRGDGDEVRQVGDFQWTDGLLLHPMLFKGPYTIEVESEGVPHSAAPPGVFVGWRWDSLQGLLHGRAYAVAFGELTRILEFDAGVMRLLDDTSTSVAFNHPFSLKVRVKSKSILATANRRSPLKVERPKGEYGQFGLTGLEHVEEIRVIGEIEPSWINGLIDQRIHEDWQRFRGENDASGILPPDLRARVEGEAERGLPFDEVAPVPGGASALAEASELLAEGEVRKGLSFARRLDDEEAPEPVRRWLTAQFLAYTGDLEAALAEVESVCLEVPGFFEGRYFHAQLFRAIQGPESGLEAFEALVHDFPGHVEPYEELARLHLLEERPARAREVLELALANGVPARALRRIGLTLHRSERGPAWGEIHEYESDNYVVRSDLSRRVCYDIAKELEKFYKKYINRVRRPGEDASHKFDVYFFSGLAGYLAYTADLLGDPAEGSLGLYSPWLEQLVLWNSPDERMVMRTVRHEGFHQYLHRLTNEAPVWLNEGLAEYYEQSRLVRGEWKDDWINEEHVALLRATANDWTPLEEFVHQDASGFRLRQGLHYPEAWAFVHFLSHSDDERADRLERLLDALVAGATRTEALEDAFEGVDWRAWGSSFRRYVEELE